MRRASLLIFLTSLSLAACREDPPADGESGSTDSGTTETGTTATTLETTETTETDATETDTGGPDDVYDGLRFVAVGSTDSTVVALDLDDPLNVPATLHISTGEGPAYLYGETPFGTEAITHRGRIEQLRLHADGSFEFTPLASMDGAWLNDLWIHHEGRNALMTVAPAPFADPLSLLWVRYDEGGVVDATFDITPPIMDGGVVFVPGRSPDSSHAAIVVDANLDSTWEIYLLPVEPEPQTAELIDQIDLTGLPPSAVLGFLSVHIDDQRIAYRREVLPMIRRPVAVPLTDPESNPVNLIPGIDHVHSIAWSEDSTRMLVLTQEQDDFGALSLIVFDGPTDAQSPVIVTDADKPALANSKPVLAEPILGNGVDALGRVFHVYATAPSMQPSGVALITVTDGLVSERLELAGNVPGAIVSGMRYDPATQLLGFRVRSGGLAWIGYADLSEEVVLPVRINQDFDVVANEPEDFPDFGWSADGSRLVIAGVQNSVPTAYATVAGDQAGSTVPISMPNVESTAGYTLDHRPRLSPRGDQVVFFYTSQAGLTGFVHGVTDGSTMATSVQGPQDALWRGAYMPHDP